jgi:chromatin segregation and condensation protein Rec8/ScpA/Scc1 (kleisin family)
LLRRRSRFDFDAELAGLSRVEQAVAFLALLELRRADEISISQAAPFAPIRVARVEESAAADERKVSWTAHSA